MVSSNNFLGLWFCGGELFVEIALNHKRSIFKKQELENMLLRERN